MRGKVTRYSISISEGPELNLNRKLENETIRMALDMHKASQQAFFIMGSYWEVLFDDEYDEGWWMGSKMNDLIRKL